MINPTHNIGKSVIRQFVDKAQPGSINLGLGEINIPLHSSISEIGKRVIREKRIGYTPNAGLPELRKAISTYYNNTISLNGVCVMNGAQEGLFALLFTYLNPGDEVILVDPCYPAYDSVVQMCKGQIRYCSLSPEDNFRMNFDLLIEQINKNTKFIVINQPSNPLGTALTDSELKKLAVIAEKHNLTIISDEVYRELYTVERGSTILDFSDRAVVISSLSKSHGMTGWRLGWIAGSEEFIKPIIVTHQYLTTCANSLAQHTAIEIFNNCFEEANIYIKDFLDTNRILAEKLLHRFEMIKGEFHPFLFVKVPDNNFAEEMLEKKVIVIPGHAFSQRNMNWVRISYGVAEEYLIKGLSIILGST